MKVGLALWADRDIRSLADLSVAAEGAGFDELWWPDHYDARECSAVLTACALATERITIGTAVTSPLLRHPAMLASLFATLSEVSNGRIVAGLGPGGFEVKTELGVSVGSPLTATREAVAILRSLTAADTSSLPDGRYFSTKEARLAFAAPPVRIYLAGRGPRMTELAGEIADGAITHGLAKTYLESVSELVARGTATSGRSKGSCEVALMLEVALHHDVGRAHDALRGRCLYMVGGEYAEELIPLYGLDPLRVRPIRAAVRARDPRAPAMIDDEMVDAFAIAGSAELVADRISQLDELGVGSVILSPGKGVSAQTITNLGVALRGVSA